jgi:endoglucanase
MKKHLIIQNWSYLIESIKYFKKDKNVLNAIFACIIFFSIQQVQAQPVLMNGALSVNGNKIVNKKGVPVSFHGNSMFWSNNGWGGEKYYNANVVSWLQSDWNAAIVRAAMGVEDNGGYLSDKVGNKNRVKAVVDAAIANNMYVIIDWHTHHAEWNTAEAITFFKEMALTYGHLPNVIYEIYNEPLAVSWSGVIKPYAIQVIDEIRKIDSDNLIIVGTPNWSADIDQPANDPINRTNIAYTVHFYAASHKQSNRDKVTYAVNKGIAVFATEWGTVEANGNGAVNEYETNQWWNLMKAYNISSCNWAINDKNEGSSALNAWIGGANGGWPTSSLTWSGNVVRNLLKSVDYGVLKDQINFFESPNLVTAKNSYTTKVNYTVLEKRNLTVTLKDDLNNIIGSTSLQVQGNTSVDVVINASSLPIVGKNYTWVASLSPLSGNTNLLDEKTNATVIILERDPIYMIEAESYNVMSGIQKEICIEGTENIGYIDSGDWLSYAPISIPVTGKYMVYFRVASKNNLGVISLEKDAGATVLSTVNVPNSNNWQTWITISKVVDLPKGSYSIGLGVPTGGFNINWFAIVPMSTTTTDITDNQKENSDITVYPSPSSDYIHVNVPEQFEGKIEVYNLSGEKMIESTDNTIQINRLPNGVYIVKTNYFTTKFIKSN